ncbi:hypothetical protein KFK09_019760 [Dendrobium nobile]|uniref:Uncharacterized protein n=1 Tax=Dendrobium nobile TaxID=94219 RepID=A0A8T3AT42_DENNO|nr:hypothetical protein KFK09_019760 [Dendrobium nobile]
MIGLFIESGSNIFTKVRTPPRQSPIRPWCADSARLVGLCYNTEAPKSNLTEESFPAENGVAKNKLCIKIMVSSGVLGFRCQPTELEHL